MKYYFLSVKVFALQALMWAGIINDRWKQSEIDLARMKARRLAAMFDDEK